jgi:hypothetical protein
MSTTEAALPSLSPSKDLVEINKRLLTLRDAGVHLVGPGVQSLVKVETLPQMYEMNWHAFRFDTDPKGPDFYKGSFCESDEVAFKRDALLKMWSAAGGRDVLSLREDTGKDPYYVTWKFGGSVMDMSGQWLASQKSKEIDLTDGSPAAAIMTPKQLGQQRSEIVSLAEAKAHNRVIRQLLGIRQKYTAREAAKPFVLMRLVLVPDMSDPLTRAMVLANAMGAQQALFGNSEFIKMIAAAPAAVEVVKQLAPPTSQQLPAAAEKQLEGSKEERLMDFTCAEVPQQIEILNGMADKKGIDLKAKLNKPLDKFTEKERKELFAGLLELVDAEPAFKL